MEYTDKVGRRHFVLSGCVGEALEGWPRVFDSIDQLSTLLTRISKCSWPIKSETSPPMKRTALSGRTETTKSETKRDVLTWPREILAQKSETTASGASLSQSLATRVASKFNAGARFRSWTGSRFKRRHPEHA